MFSSWFLIEKNKFYRQVIAGDPGYFRIELEGRTTTWAVITTITDVNQDNPIKDVSGTSCDGTGKSVFPSVYGKENDVLLLSQCFDDTASAEQFTPPPDMVRLGWTHSKDEVRLVLVCIIY